MAPKACDAKFLVLQVVFLQGLEPLSDDSEDIDHKGGQFLAVLIGAHQWRRWLINVKIVEIREYCSCEIALKSQAERHNPKGRQY